VGPVILPVNEFGKVLVLMIDETGTREGTPVNAQYAVPMTATTMITLTATAVERFIPPPLAAGG
jgi:hypothetical protein